MVESHSIKSLNLKELISKSMMHAINLLARSCINCNNQLKIFQLKLYPCLIKSLSIDDRLSLLSNKIDNMNSDLHNYYDGVTIFLWSFVGIFTTIGISYYLC